MAFKETARNAVDQVRSLPGKAKKFSKATALAVLMAVGGAAASDAEAQTTYIDTIPEEHKNLCLVYVTDDLLETLDMTTEEFYDRKVKEHFDWLNKSHYYSGNTNDTSQIVEIVAGDQVQELSTEGLPDQMRSSDANGYLSNKNDGIRENVDADMECYDSHTIVLYGKFTNIGSNRSEYISLEGETAVGMGSTFTLHHEMGHRYGGAHYNSSVRPPITRPTKIDSITPRHEEFAEYRDAPISAEERLPGKRTIMNAGPSVGIYSSPEIRTPDSESNMVKVVRDKLLELHTESPMLEADILPPADSLEVNEMATLEAGLNRDSLNEYDFNWTVWQDGQVVHTGTGPTLNYMPTDTGMLEVELFAQKACGGQSDSTSLQLQVINSSTSSQTTITQGIDLYPNPTTGLLVVHIEEHLIKEMKIISLLGEEIPLPVSTTVNIGFLSPGIYYLQVDTEEGIFTQKVIKQ